MTEGFYPSDLIDSRSANIDTWTDFDGATATEVNAEMLVRVTQDNPSSGSPPILTFKHLLMVLIKEEDFNSEQNLQVMMLHRI